MSFTCCQVMYFERQSRFLPAVNAQIVSLLVCKKKKEKQKQERNVKTQNFCQKW